LSAVFFLGRLELNNTLADLHAATGIDLRIHRRRAGWRVDGASDGTTPVAQNRRTAAAVPQANTGPNFQNPSPHRFVGDIQTALSEQQIFCVAIAEHETDIEPRMIEGNWKELR
jgi:hypothetical protein